MSVAVPELPEMEHYKQVLTPRIVGIPITSVTIEREKSLNVPSLEFENEVVGQTLTKITVFYKNI